MGQRRPSQRPQAVESGMAARGIGRRQKDCIRTGTAAACLLKHLGLPRDEALQAVRAAGSNPENAEQSGLVDLF